MVEEKVEPDVCIIAIDEALNVVFEKCGKERALKEIAKFLGFKEEELKELNPLTEHCKMVLEKGITEAICKSFRGIRSWVMCRAFELIEKEKMGFRDALKTAWAEAHEKCLELGCPI